LNKSGPRKIGLACLLRRISRLPDSTGASQLVATGPHAHPGAPVRLEEGLDGGRLGLSPDGTAARLWFHLQQPSDDTDTLIGVLELLA